MIFEGDITIPYKWTTGPTVGRFLAEIRDNARLLGAKCGRCEKVYLPPVDICGECFQPLSEWIELSGEGTALAVTEVNLQSPFSSVTPPYALGLIRMDGADTDFIHYVAAGVKVGDRVRPRFRPDREGSILDIEHFDHSAEIDNESAALNEDVPAAQVADQESPEFRTVGEAFQHLPARFRPGKVDRTMVYYFSIDDEKWTVTVRPDGCEVTPGKTTDEADCFLKTSTEMLVRIFKGEHTPSIMDFMSGKIKSNRPDLLLAFKDAFDDRAS